MMLSNRANPPKALNVTSHQLSVKQFLLHSPIPSPCLPSILPRHGKKPQPLNTDKILRVLCWLVIGTTIFWIASLCHLPWPSQPPKRNTHLPPIYPTAVSHAEPGLGRFPEYPSPVMVTDSNGQRKWTISIPKELDFPLSFSDYADICVLIPTIVKGQTAAGNKKLQSSTPDSPNVDSIYLDVSTAQAQSLLPYPSSRVTSGEHQPGKPICKKSLTYILDASEAGLGKQLLGLWLSYGLAKRQGREFFIDDSHFAYGNHTTFFQPLPPSSCVQPDRTQMVPCPQQASHLVVSTSTFSWTFGAKFRTRWSKQEIYDMVRVGYEALYKLRADDAKYVDDRLSKLRNNVADSTRKNRLVGIHVRRGDRHPFEFAHQQGYLPSERYIEAAQARTRVWAGNHIPKTTSNTNTTAGTTIVLATDDPDIYTHPDFVDTAVRAQDRITLASKRALSNKQLGWEGGFFKDVFWGLGLPLQEALEEKQRLGSPLPTRQKQKLAKEDRQNANLAQNEKGGNGRGADLKKRDDVSAPNVAGTSKKIKDNRSHPNLAASQLRELIGRAYLMELSVLSQTDGVVCAVSSYTCRLLAVMLGWKSAFDDGNWINVDSDYGWMTFDE